MMPKDSPKTKARLLAFLDELQERLLVAGISARSLDTITDRMSPGGVFPTLRKELESK